jgi:hypothetical protein
MDYDPPSERVSLVVHWREWLLDKLARDYTDGSVRGFSWTWCFVGSGRIKLMNDGWLNWALGGLSVVIVCAEENNIAPAAIVWWRWVSA